MPEGDIWNVKFLIHFKMLTITSETPIAALTVGQFKELFFTTYKIENQKHQNSSPETPIFGVKECSKITGYSASAIYQRTSKGLIPCFRRDGKLLFRRDEIISWMTECRVETVGVFSQKMDEKLTKRRGR